jgi:hypothetical protein
VRHISLLFLIFGVAWMAYAIRGILRRRIRTYPRGARGTTFEGREAIRQGFVELLVGLAVSAVALVLYLSS